MRAKIGKIIVLLAIILLPLGSAKAMDAKTGDSIYVSKDEIVNGNLYAAGNTITVDGNISGDLIVAAETVNVNGRVEGDIIAAAQNININGEVGGNIRVIGSAINLNGPVTRNVNAFAPNVILGTNSHVGWDVFAAGATLESRGSIDGSLSGAFQNALIYGKIGKNIDLKMSENKSSQGLIISPEANVGGDVNYVSKKMAQVSNHATISGKVYQRMPQIKQTNWTSIWLWSKLYAILAALAVGLVLVLLLKKVTPKIIEKIEDKTLRTFLYGLIIMFILPPIALILLCTIIGIPLALIIIGWWIIAIYIAKILTSIFVGQFIIKKLTKINNPKLLLSLVIGVFICWLLFAIPFVGWFISLIAIWLGLGGFFLYASNQLRNI